MILSNGVDLFVEQRGAGLPALIFLHYWGGSSRTWSKVIDGLAPDFRTIAIDQRGWGRSQAPASGYSLVELAADVEEVVTQLRLERYILVGHSMGAKVSQLLASRRPPGLVGLALVAPSPPSPMRLPLEVREAMVRAYISRESIIATVEQVLAPNGLDPIDLEAVIADSLRGSLAAKEAWPMWVSQEDISVAVTNINVPTVVISGALDRVDPPEVLRAELLPRIPQASFYVLPEVGHLSPLEAADEVTRIISLFAFTLFDQ